MRGDEKSRHFSKLLNLQAPASISNPSLSARSIAYIESINSDPFARTKTEAKSAVGSPPSLPVARREDRCIPPLLGPGSPYGIQLLERNLASLTPYA